jgi:hypothetical protein
MPRNVATARHGDPRNCTAFDVERTNLVHGESARAAALSAGRHRPRAMRSAVRHRASAAPAFCSEPAAMRAALSAAVGASS